MTPLEYVLDFSLKFGEALWHSGATLERINDSVYRICDSYGCKEVHFFSLNCYMTLTLLGPDGERVSSQRCFNGEPDIHMEKMQRLNDLSRHICRKPPQPEELSALLADALDTTDYSTLVTGAARLGAMAAIGAMSGATMRDIVVVLLNSALLFLAGIHINRPGINRIVYNVVSTFLAGTITIGLLHAGLVDDAYVVMIVVGMMLLPGIPIVNSIRNLLCGNEINGILELLKAMMETAAIVGGFVLSCFFFGGTLL